MHHIMAKATVRELRYNFRAIEARLNRGEEIDLYKRKKMIGRLIPAVPQGDAYPDFAAISRKIFGRKKFKKTAAEIISEERGDF